MISLISELTDSKAVGLPGVGFVSTAVAVYALRSQADVERTIEKRGFGLAALQDPRSRRFLGLPTDQCCARCESSQPNNELYGGVDAIVFLARQIWWGWLIYAAAQLPGMQHILQAGIVGFADHRIVLPAFAQ